MLFVAMRVGYMFWRALVYDVWIVFIAGLRDLDSNLGAYPYDSLKRWVSLTNHVSETLVARYHCMIISLTIHHCVLLPVSIEFNL